MKESTRKYAYAVVLSIVAGVSSIAAAVSSIAERRLVGSRHSLPVPAVWRIAAAVSTIAAAVSTIVVLSVVASSSTVAADSAMAPASPDGVWQAVDDAPLQAAHPVRWIVPQVYGTVRLDPAALQKVLDRAPREFTLQAASSPAVLTIPMPDGSFARFAIVTSPIMEPPLAARFPQIRTYGGQGLDDRTATVRLDWTPDGFHAMVISASSTVFVDPYSRGDTQHYISYDKRDYKREGEIPRCLLAEEPEPLKEDGGAERARRFPPETTGFAEAAAATPLTPVGPTLKIYRLAVAADGEYTQFHGGTVPAGLSAITTTMNRVDGVYEREFAVRLVLVANETSIIYTDPSTDPYTNTSASALLTQNQSNLDAVIGNANYDIGHVFTTGGGGLSTLGVVCVSGSKARSETGSSTPIGDGYDIDYVAHEMGHQFGDNHTFNGTTSNCGGGNRSSGSAYEPGSASTIMGYAGICGAEDLQPHSDDYFHTKSFDSTASFINGTGGTCAVNQATGNQSPIVDAGPNFTIPIGTPFTLTAASGSDPDGDPITYCWEEFDLGTAAPPNTDNGSRPVFRSFNPTTSPSRTFPKLSDILNNTSTLGESLPITNRTMTFRVTARDNRANGGGVNYDSMTVTSTTSAGPFIVTRPNTALSWMGNSTQTVNWNVAGTAGAPVNAANVRISLSTDGGNTFPTVLLASTPNDGTQTVTIPDTPTTTARIKVEPVGNIFFDISNTDFTVLADTHSPFLSVEQVVTTPIGADGDPYLEPGEAGSLLVTLTNNGTVAATNVTGTLTATTPGVTVVTTQPVAYPDLGLNASGVNTIPYRIAVSSSVPCGTPLNFNVTGSFAEPGGPSVRPFAVTTGGPATFTYSYLGSPVPIPDNSALGADATILVSGFSGLLTDVNVALDGTSCSSAVGSTTVGLDHTYVGDLSVRLISPLGTSVTVMSRPGGSNNSGNNFCQTVLDDAGATSIQSITSAGAPFVGTFSPSSPLSPFNGQDPNGTWRLNVADVAAQDTGNIRSWSLRLGGNACSSAPPAPGTVPGDTGGTPLTVARIGGDLTLSWGASCSASGIDYAIYQGSIGTYYSHAMKFCTTQGLLTKTFTPDPGDWYFLVVAQTADNEGSYGKASNLTERPPGNPACKPQLLGGCP